MGDLDVTKAGGATGALSRATQLANQRAANALRVANALRKQRYDAQRAANMGGRNLPGGGEGFVQPRRVPPPRKPVPKMGPSKMPGKKSNRADYGLGLVTGEQAGVDALGNPVDQYGNPLQGPGYKRHGGGLPETVQLLTNPDSVADTTAAQLVDNKTGKPGVQLPGGAGPGYMAPADWQFRNAKDIDRFRHMSPKQQEEVRDNVKATQDGGKVAKTVKQMLDDLKKDPLQDSERFLAGRDLADAFSDMSQSRYFTNRDLRENPLLATLNELSVWSTYRLKVSDWKANKNKTGGSGLLSGVEGDGEEGGDGTFAGIVDNGSFSSVTSPSNLSPYLVTRDEDGLLQVVTADQWIQGKFAEMRHNPAQAARMITALAMTSAYGSDSSANNQRSRVVVDGEGNPIKAFVSAEDLRALKELANQVAILQNNGDEVAIDDSIAELTKMAAQVGAETTANGDYEGGGGYGGYGGGGGGYGGGGGGGQSVQLTDPTELTSLVGSIARQRMGRELTPEESALFVQYYHGMERNESANYYAGGEFTRLDPEGQAVAWITSHFQEEAAKNQYGNLAAEFITMMGGSNPFAGIAG